MKVYLDLIFIFDLIIDYILLLIVKKTLKRNISDKRLLLGSLFGAFSTMLISFKLNNIILFFSKIIIAIFINVLSFKYKNISYTIKNVFYFYLSSLILGGTIYLLINPESNRISYYLLVIFITIIMYFIITYILNNIKTIANNYVSLVINVKEKNYSLTGYIDSGNFIKDPYSNKSVIIINKNIIKNIESKVLYIPITTINGNSLLKAIKPKYVLYNNNICNNFLIALSNNKIGLNGIDCILNKSFKEEFIC